MNDAFAARLSFDDTTMWIHLSDGRTLGIPLSFFPRLLQASPEQRLKYIFSGNGKGLHWDELNEDISVEHLLMGHRDTTTEQHPYTSARATAGLRSSVKRQP